jgi:threonine dehydratase
VGSTDYDRAVIARADVEAARAVIGGRLHRTPTFSSGTLSKLVGAEVFLKAELFQRTGSFKPRGVLNKLASLAPEERERGVIGVSAGNHAQALAYGSALEGLDCLMVMWKTASAQKVAATKGYGAAVDLEAEGPAVVFERLAQLLEETGRTLVHPFDDPLVAAGQGTVALEIEEDVSGLDTIVVPVGGGGLLSGITAAFSGRVIAVEPEVSQALHAGLRAGRPVPVEPASVADGLNAPFAGKLVLEICAARGLETSLVSEAEIEAAMRFLYERAKLACEPAGAAATAALLAGKVTFASGERVAAIVSGGNVATQTASGILA